MVYLCYKVCECIPRSYSPYVQERSRAKILAYTTKALPI